MKAGVARSRSKVSFVDPAKFTPHFRWKRKPAAIRGEELCCEGVSVSRAAAEFGTPAYLYSSAAITEAFRELHRGLGAVPHTLCFAMKANGNLSILKLLADLGSGFDIVSGGELEHLRRIGVRGDRIVFSGVGKTREEIRAGLQYRAANAASAPAFCFLTLNRKPSWMCCWKKRLVTSRAGTNRRACRFA